MNLFHSILFVSILAFHLNAAYLSISDLTSVNTYPSVVYTVGVST